MIRKLFLLTYGLLFLVASIAHADTQTVNVTGTVIPRATDFQLSVANNTTGTIAQNTSVTYTITYGTHLLYADHITVEASWDNGTVNGSSTPSVDGVDYLSGSASNAYNSTTPVVDLTNHTIDWSITSFPSQTTNQTVTFTLRTNSSYSGSNTVTFPVKVKLIASNYTTSSQSTTVTYQFDNSQVTPTPTPGPTNTPTPGPTNTPTPGPTATPTPKNQPTPTVTPVTQTLPAFLTVSILNLDANNADIGYIVMKNGVVSFAFGTSPGGLAGKQTSSNPGYGTFHVGNLLPQQKYYFQLSLGGEQTEIFSFTTPPVSQIPQIVKTSLVVATNNDVLYSAGLQNNNAGVDAALTKLPTVAVSLSTTYSLSFKVTKTQQIKSVQILLQNSNVLGLATTAFAQETQNYPYIYAAADKGNGVYTANIANTLPPGTYNMFLVVRDADGNITTEQVANMHILHPFRALNSKSKEPIEDVRIALSRLDSGQYSPVIGIRNPLYTGRFGTVEEQLVTGKYKAVFSRIGYETVTKEFSVGLSPTDDYPTAYLVATPITLGRIFGYYQNAFLDYLVISNTYIDSIHQSYRFFDLIGLAVLFCAVIVTLLLFSIKSHLGLAHLPIYFHHHFLTLLQKESKYTRGRAVDGKTGLPLVKASVFLIDEQTRHVVAQTTTNTKGFFLFSEKGEHHGIVVMKQGYEPSGQFGYIPDMTVSLTPGVTSEFILWNFLVKATENALGLFFEFLLVLSVILEIFLFPAFGLFKTVPFLAMSIANSILWIFYLHERGKEIV